MDISRRLLLGVASNLLLWPLDGCRKRSMTAAIRGPSVSFNSLAANPDLLNAIAFFDFTIPSDWDNTDPFEHLTMDIIGGVVADAATPTDIDVSFQCRLRSVDGGSWLAAATNGAGNSLAIGAKVYLHGASQTSNSLTSTGLNQDSGEFSLFTGADVTAQNCTLFDGAAEGFAGHAGQGFGQNTFGPVEWNGPIGWNPYQGSDNGATAAILFNPGDVVTLGVVMITDVGDSVNPDRSVYGVIQSLKMAYKGTEYPIDLTTFKTGFGSGGSYTAVISSITQSSPTYFNARKTIDFTPAPTDHPNERAFIDLYLIDASPVATQTSQGHIF